MKKPLLVTTCRMRNLLIVAIAIMWSCAAHAADYTYLCRVNHKSYPVMLDEDKGTLTWRGTTFLDLKQVESDCKAEFTATANGVTADLCAAND
jgi:hypothetical protein